MSKTKVTVAGVKVGADTWGDGKDYKIYYTRTTKENGSLTPESVFIDVEWYGESCIDTNLHPKDPTNQYLLLLTKGTGCGQLGKDTTSVVADKLSINEFLTDNGDLLAKVLKLP